MAISSRVATLALAVLALIAAQASAQDPPCDTLPTNRYYRIINRQSYLPLTVEEPLMANGANIAQGTIAQGANKNWRLQADANYPGYYYIINELSGLSAVVEGSSQRLGATIVQGPKTYGQVWCFADRSGSGNGYYEVKNFASTQGFDATQSGGNDVLQWGYWGGKNQQWTLEYVKDVGGSPPTPTPPVAPPTPAPVVLPTPRPVKPPTPAPVVSPTPAPVKPPTKAPVVSPTPAPVKPPTKAPVPTGGNPVVGQCDYFAPNTVFQIKAHDGTVVTVESGSSNVATAASGTANSQWLFQSSGGGYYKVVAKSSLKLMQREAGEGANVVVGAASGQLAEWCFEYKANGKYAILNRANKQIGLDVDIAWWLGTEGNVQTWWHYGGDNQFFAVEAVAGAPPTPVPPPTPAPVVAPVPKPTPAPVVAPVPQPTPAPNPPTPVGACGSFAPNTLYKIRAFSKLLIAPLGGLGSPGATLVTLNEGGEPYKLWRFVPSFNGYYHVINEMSGLSMQKSLTSKDVLQGPMSPGVEDEWCFEFQGDGKYFIKSRWQPDETIDIENYGTAPGSNVQTYWAYGGANQLFTVELAGGAPSPPTPPPPPPPPGAVDDWVGPYGLPIIAVAMAHLANGKILMWSAFAKDGFGFDEGKTWTAIYDPNKGSVSELLVDTTNHDMFCPGTVTLKNGNIMITGGANANVTTIYDWKNDSWSSGDKMNTPRGYQGMTILGDGSVFVVGGSWSGPWGDKNGEHWVEGVGWRPLSGVPVYPFLTNDKAGMYRADNHPWLFVAPNGMVFHAGPSKKTHFVDLSTTAGSVIKGPVRNTQDQMNGNAVMYDIGKILTVGGCPNYDKGLGSKFAHVININNGISATVKRVGDMAYSRTLSNCVVLPSGEVVVIGGQSETLLFSDSNAVYWAEIYNPVTETFTTLGKMTVPRTYHSTAILMKDGRVISSGGGLCGGCDANHKDLEILTPPYLIDANGNPATRPVIKSASASTKAGGKISVQMDTTGVHTFAMVRLGAVTHSVNNDQRRFPVTGTKSGAQYELNVPSNPNVAVTGVYFLFAMNAAGVPCIAVDVRIDL